MNTNFEETLKQISKIMGDTIQGLSNSEIDQFIFQIDKSFNIDKDKTQTSSDGLYYILGKNKKDRIFNFGLFLAKKHNSLTSIKMICEAYLNPTKWVNNKNKEKYNNAYTEVNKILNINGYEINHYGQMIKIDKINTINELNEKWNSLYSEIKEYNKKELICKEIVNICDLEAKKDFYYHVIDQVCKHLEQKIKEKLITDNKLDMYKDAWNLLEEKVTIVKNKKPFFITKNFKAEHSNKAISSINYQNGYVFYIKGLIKYVRNLFAHTSRVYMGDITKNETLSLLVVLSRAFDFLDSLQQI